MSGHSKWAQIKHQKGVIDKKRGILFSKILTAISAAAKTEPDPKFNPRLRTAIEKAKINQVPSENIARAIAKAKHDTAGYDELTLEAYTKDGAAVLIEVLTDNRNRAVAELKKLISDYGGKWAEPGSVAWIFEKKEGEWHPKFPQKLTPKAVTELQAFKEALEVYPDVQGVWTNEENPHDPI